MLVKLFLGSKEGFTYLYILKTLTKFHQMTVHTNASSTNAVHVRDIVAGSPLESVDLQNVWSHVLSILSSLQNDSSNDNRINTLK